MMLSRERRCRRRGLGSFRPRVEGLEGRALLAVVTVDAGQTVRPVNNQVLGVNLAWWDTNLNTPQTQQLVQDAGLTMFRFPGGSSSDEYHFSDPPSYTGKGTAATFARFIASVHGQGMVTLDYGSGSPQEAAAFLAYLNGSTGNTTALGTGPEWNTQSQSWQSVDWKTAGFWASLRASAPLAQDDGLNFLRINHPAPFGFHYYEVGNEEYGGWETDHHASQHDPATYVAFAKQFAGYAAQIDSTISIGVDTGSVSYDNNWTANVLQQGVAQGFIPGFLSDHSYMQAPGSENDPNLLLHTVSDPNTQAPGSPYNWAQRAAGYRQLLQQTLGAKAAGVELLATEFNSVYSNPGKQTTSLVNGLFVADSLGSLLGTEYNGADIWDLRNGWDTGNNNSSSLYGWRQGGDYGLLGSPNGAPPSTGTNVPYPAYFAEQLLAKMVHNGDTVVPATSNDPNLSVYAVHEANGHLDLLVINKSPSSDITGQFQVQGFQAGAQAQVWQYGKAQDTAQSQSGDGHSALASSTATLTLNGPNFGYLFPSYSMTVLDLSGGSVNVPPPTITATAAANPSPVVGTTTALSVGATDASGGSDLTYTWATSGIPPAPVSFSVNKTNGARNSTATFTRAGSYTFQVTVTEPGAPSASSRVTVVVNQTLTSVVVSPSSASIVTGGSRQFAAQGRDQFGNALASPPSFSWSVIGGGVVSSSGLYTAPATSGTARVQASSGALSGSATVTITPRPTLSAQATFADTNDWGSGFTGQETIKNTGTVPINGWTLQFDFAPNISQVWNARIVSHVGPHYVIRDAGYNATIAPGQSVSFGFNATPGHLTTWPVGYLLNGVPLSAPPIPPPPPLGASVAFADTNDWGSGFTGRVTITDTGAGAINGWTLQFDFSGAIFPIWNAVIVSHVGNHYVLRDAGYNSFIAPGQNISFGFVATPGHVQPSRYVLNGVALSGGSNGVATTVVPQKAKSS